MKTFITVLLFILSVSTYADNARLNYLTRERNHQLQVFLALQDSVIPGKIVKMTFLNDQLLKMVSIDDSIIDITNQLSISESQALDSLSKSQQTIKQLSFDNETMQQRTKNDLRMLLIMKIAVAVLILLLLTAIYFIFKKRNNLEDIESDKNKAAELENEKAELRLEIDRLKIHENNLKGELDSQIRLQQEQLNSLNDRYRSLESENANLKILTSQRSVDNESNATLIERIKLQNETLIRESSELQKQLFEAKSKNDSIMKKIAKLISDLSGVSA